MFVDVDTIRSLVDEKMKRKLSNLQLTDRLSSLNGMIPLEWLNNSIETY